MVFKIIYFVISLTLSFASYGNEISLVRSSDQIIKAEDIFSSPYIDIKSITDTLYKQFRPKVNITQPSLSKEVIDQKTKEYIQTAYVPSLVKNYIQLYKSINRSGNTINSCNNKIFSPMSEGSNLHISLCVNKADDNLSVKYFSKFDERSEKENIVFIFNDGPKPILIGIEMSNSPNKVSVSGI